MFLNKNMDRAAYLTAAGRIAIRDTERHVAGQGELLLRPLSVGLCGSDVHFFETALRRGEPIGLPLILGHECSCEVIGIGNGARGFETGERVIVEPQKTCGKCMYCKNGNYNMCPDVQFLSTPPVDGVLRSSFSHPAELCYRLPDSMSNTEGALIEPFAVGLNAAETGDIGPGKKAVILGGGCIGLATLIAVRCYGASKVLVSDLFDSRLKKALDLGADYVVNAEKEDTVEVCRRIFGEAGPDAVFETAGSAFTMAQAGRICGRCGHIIAVGNVNGKVPFDFLDLMFKGGDIRTIYRYRNNFGTALSLVSSGKAQVAKLISHEFSFDDVQTAFETALNQKNDVIKIAIRMDGK